MAKVDSEAKMQENRRKLLELVKSAPREYRQTLLDELDGDEGLSSAALKTARQRIAELEKEHKAGGDGGQDDAGKSGGSDDSWAAFTEGL